MLNLHLAFVLASLASAGEFEAFQTFADQANERTLIYADGLARSLALHREN